ncbi:MAG: UvrD-helicase domain-containing protein [Chlamydiota bacterium]
MQRFDCLSRDCPLFGPHLLEASAGTGKTFSIEHVYVRLILESQKDPIEVEQILAVTFTRAAARELKARIRANLEKALFFLSSNQVQEGWDYLEPYIGSKEAMYVLGDALGVFDRSQIFTIHGFCSRMLREFAFEANIGFSMAQGEKNKIPTALKEGVRDFLESGIKEELLCPEQLVFLLREYDSFEAISDQLLRVENRQGVSFKDQFSCFREALRTWTGAPIEEACLRADFHSLEKGYKVEVKGDFEAELTALAKSFISPDDPIFFRQLLKEKGTLFDFLSPTNRKIKGVLPEFLHYPGVFDWGRNVLAPLIKQTPKKILQTLQAAWYPIAKKILESEEFFTPDEILSQMKSAVEKGPFAELICQKYKAVIIDEFQDTDALQWDVFHRLFLKESSSLRALYLVGDPKQSIYRFRGADVYTYLKARDLLGEKHLYHLDTNFRSSKNLVGALNALFSREWLHLPKANRTLPYHPVKAGARTQDCLPDEKGALHFMLLDGDAESLFDTALLPFVLGEIERLTPFVKNRSAFAILVKDRYRAELARSFLKERNISAIARSHTPIGETVAFQAIRELFEAVYKPQDQNVCDVVMAGPFGSTSGEFPFFDFKSVLTEKGLVGFWRLFLDHQLSGQSTLERIVSFDLSFYRDAMQIFEYLFDFEAREGFSFEGLSRTLKDLRSLAAEEGGRRRVEGDEDAVQIMTLHVSKGLEFDVVFALGLAARTPDGGEEIEEMDAEKLRQLYVAMTRAKRRLYVPVSLHQKESKSGTHSPIELFCRLLEKETPLQDILANLSSRESMTFERLFPTALLPVEEAVSLNFAGTSFQLRPLPYSTSYLSSFTSLSLPSHSLLETKWIEPFGVFNLHTMPRGKETGVVIHRIFERLFSEKGRCEEKIHSLVAEELQFSSLEPWQESIQQMVQETLALPLREGDEVFCLGEIDFECARVEMEFLFSYPPHFVKGFIDLIFCHKEKYYILDWKTNWLGPTEADYQEPSLRAVMQANNYDLQAALYTEALGRHLGEGKALGGVFYLFVRAGAYLHFHPDLNIIRECYGLSK